jgi:hypothetical protein
VIFHHHHVDYISDHKRLRDNYNVLKEGKDLTVDVPSVLLFAHYEGN